MLIGVFYWSVLNIKENYEYYNNLEEEIIFLLFIIPF